MSAPSPFTIPPSPTDWSALWWTALWHQAGHHSVCPSDCPSAGRMHPDYDAAEAWARARLRAAGHRIDVNDYVDRVDISEVLLTLAALYCPELFDR